ncbi:MAG: hypothetical protein AAF456_06865 [Planctomycetota bacterium]
MLGLFIRFQVAQESLWIDELHTAWVTGGSFSDVSQRAKIGNQTPVYFHLVFAAVQSLPGERPAGPFSIRLVSLASGVGLILAIGFLVWRWTGSFPAVLVAVAISALDPVFVFYATEARPYVLMQLFCVLQVIAFFLCLRETCAGQGGGLKFHCTVLIFAMTTALVVGTHVTGIWIVFAELVWITATCRWQKIGAPASAYIAGATLVLVFVAVGDPRELFSRRANWASLSSIPGLFQAWSGHLVLIGLATFAGAIGCVSKSGLTQSESEVENNAAPDDAAVVSYRGLLLFAACWCLAPLFCVSVLHFAGLPLALSRYTLIGVAGLPVICGLAIEAFQSRWLKFFVSAVLVVIFIYGNGLITSWYLTAELPLLRTENWAAVIEKVNETDSRSTQPVFLLANLLEDVAARENTDPDFQDYLKFPVASIYELDSKQRQIVVCPTHVEPLSDADLQLLIERRGAWIIMRARAEDVSALLEELESRLIAELQSNGNSQNVSIELIPTFQPNDVSLISISF